MLNIQQTSAIQQGTMLINTYINKIDTDNYLHNCICGEEHLSEIPLMILLHDVKINYKEV